VVDKIAGDQCGARHAKVAKYPVHGDAHAGVFPCLHHNRQADWTIDCRKSADGKQPNGDLQRRVRQGGCHRRQANTDKEDAHHPFAAPFVGKPTGRQREQTKGQEARGGVLQEVGIAQAPVAIQSQCRHGGKDQREQVIEKMAEVEEEKMQALAHVKAL
jgi:hypothetical protein